MNFGNNIEKLGFEKSTWPMVEIIPIPNGNIVYRGRPKFHDARPDDPVWYIQKIVIENNLVVQKITTTSTDDFKYRWLDRETLNYMY